MPSTRETLIRYGLAALFVLPPACIALSRFAMQLFVSSTATGAGSLGTFLGAFALTVLASWAAVLFSLLLAVGLFLDSRRVQRTEGGWSPTPLYALAGVVHGVGTALLPAFAVSVPVIGYYLYRRWGVTAG
ncbi:hypothetical protein NDI54_03670 [Haloarcula sp. S1AR25-5A]|uniref:Uncharacterized protein n=1 Tax=Haloarcula terrestris TaxID=2950533 RepID=A0AAE4JFS0_9EURY|nr:hypothetical protein [Haloarcula terrestris]MDS0220447.1 hypothetical protein [Haloarcula terrestris]